MSQCHCMEMSCFEYGNNSLSQILYTSHSLIHHIKKKQQLKKKRPPMKAKSGLKWQHYFLPTCYNSESPKNKFSDWIWFKLTKATLKFVALYCRPLKPFQVPVFSILIRCVALFFTHGHYSLWITEYLQRIWQCVLLHYQISLSCIKGTVRTF